MGTLNLTASDASEGLPEALFRVRGGVCDGRLRGRGSGEHVDREGGRAGSGREGRPGRSRDVPVGNGLIFAPYTTDGDVDAVTRVRGASRDAHDIAGRDDINLLMFAEQGRIVRSVAHRRDRGDFGPELAGKCFARDRAVFSVRTAPSGSRGTIGPG